MNHKTSSPSLHLPSATWAGLGSQLRTLLTRSPLVTAGVVAVASAGVVIAYRQAQAERRAAYERRRVVRLVKTNFANRRLEILQFLYEAEWNHFSLSRLEAIYAAFLALLVGEKRRGVIPISDLVQLYKASGVNDERVAISCARFWDRDGDAHVDFIELVERLNLVVFGSVDAQLRAYFSVFDLDGSNTISKAEMMDVFSALSVATKADAKNAQHALTQKLFRSADTNKDGLFTFKEFLQLSEVEGLSFSFHDGFVRAFGIDLKDRTRALKQ